MHKMEVLAAAAAFLMTLAAPLALANDNQTGSWLDLEGCQICAPMMAEKGLVDHMHWTNKPFAAGMVMASSVDPGYELAYQRAGAKMQKLIERYMGGEPMKVCGQCASMKELATAGAKIEQMEAAGTDLTVVSATDPKLIERIHAHSDRTNSEMQKMATAEK